MKKAIIGKYYKDLKLAKEELAKQYKDKYLKTRQPLILAFNNGYLIVAKNSAEIISA